MPETHLKRLKVVVTRTTDLATPGKIVLHPEEEIQCLEIDGVYYLPTIQWMKYEPPEKPRRYANEKWSMENTGAWVGLDGEEESAVEKVDGVGQEDTVFSDGKPEPL